MLQKTKRNQANQIEIYHTLGQHSSFSCVLTFIVITLTEDKLWRNVFEQYLQILTIGFIGCLDFMSRVQCLQYALWCLIRYWQATISHLGTPNKPGSASEKWSHLQTFYTMIHLVQPSCISHINALVQENVNPVHQERSYIFVALTHRYMILHSQYA